MRPSLFVLISLIFAGFASRLIPHAWNFTPVIAMALVAGVYARPRWLAFALPFAGMWLSDLVLNNLVYAQYYEGFRLFGDAGAYLGIAACAALPLLAKTHPTASWAKLLGTGAAGVVLFFLISNAMTWATAGLYPLTPAGLLACYVAGLPFLSGTALGTLVFGGVGVAVMRGVQAREVAMVRA